MATDDKTIVSLAMLQRYSYNLRDSLNSVLDGKQDLITFNPNLSANTVVSALNYLNTSNTNYFLPGAVYIHSTPLSTGDTIDDAGLIAAYNRHQPLQINNLTLYYQCTNNGLVQYANISYNMMNTVITIYLFDSTTNALTIRTNNI